MLLFWSGGSTGTVSFSVSDTASISATEGSFDSVTLDVTELVSISETEVITEQPSVSQGDTASLHLGESVSVTVTGVPVAQSLSDTVSLTLADSFVEFIALDLTDTTSITITDVVTSNQFSSQALADSVSITTSDSFVADIGVPNTISIAFDDTINLRTFEVMRAVIHSEVQIKHINFFAHPDHITFTT